MSDSNAPQPMPMSEQEIEAAEKRCQAATDGPWWSFEDTYEGDEGWWVLGPKDGGLEEHHTLVALPYNPNAQVDAEFTAHARTDVPRLIATIRHLQSSLAEVRAERDGLQQRVAELAFRLKPLAEMDTDGQSAMMTIPTWANVWDILKAREALAQQPPSPQAGDAE